MRIMIYSGNKNNNISEAGVTTSLLFIHKISSKGYLSNFMFQQSTYEVPKNVRIHYSFLTFN